MPPIGQIASLETILRDVWVPGSHLLTVSSGGGGGGGDVNLNEVGGVSFALGQSNKAGSLPVTIASDQPIGGGTQYAELSTTTPATGNAMLGRYQASPITLTDGEMSMPLLDNFGQLKVVPLGTVSSNITQIGGASLALGQTSRTGSLPVTIASDQPALAASLNAETTKVIGTVNQGTSPWITQDSFSQTTPVIVTWTASTTLNTASAVNCADYSSVIVTFVGSGSSFATGAITFEVYDGANWFPLQAARVNAYTVDSIYTLGVATLAWELDVGGWQQIRVRLSTVITGTGSPTALVTITAQSAAADPSIIVGQSNASQLNATVIPGSSTGAVVPAVAQPIGVQALSADPSATTTTYNTIPIADLLGKLVTLPYAIPNKFVNGTASATGTSSTSLIGAVSSNKLYLTSVQVMNTGATTAQILLQDGNGGTTKAVIQAPAGGGANVVFPVPIANTSGNAWYFAAGGSSSTIFVSAQGYASTN